jgi:electron transfer flavoprotein alpha subunit
MVDSLYGIKEESKEIWVFLERDGNQLEGVSLELLGKSREIADQLGWQVCGLLIGNGIQNLSQQACNYGADRVWVADHPLLEDFTIEGYGQVAFQAIMAGKPSVFLSGATPNGRDLAGRLAVRLRTGLNADCTNLYMNIDRVVLVSEVSGFGGGVLALIEMADHRPQMATVRPGVFPPAKLDARRAGEVRQVAFNLKEETIHTRVRERVIGAGLDLTQVQNLVVGGRGIGGNFHLMQELATLIGGDFGATRPPVDDGHIERERMVGQTGVICRPKVAICCGISGAFHFVVGVQEAETVIAINTDPEAPIFEHADYCVVADVGEIVPALIEALRMANNGQGLSVDGGGRR